MLKDIVHYMKDIQQIMKDNVEYVDMKLSY